MDEAYERLVTVARADAAHAMPAWRAVRRAALATQSLWTPHEDDLAVANAAIAALAAADPAGAKQVPGSRDVADAAARLAYHEAQLARAPRPSGAPLALAVVGILCWLLGVGVLVRRGLDDAGHLVRRPALLGAIVTMLGVVGWAAGLYNA